MKKATISLSIIVKNEAHIILTMLNTVYTLLDYYIVVDTGSYDGTQEIIKNFFDSKGIPGEIIQHEWKNYGDARNVALEATKGKADYGFWIDADDKLIIDSKFDVDKFKTELFNYDGMRCNYYRGIDFTRISFFSTIKPWKWFGALHEILECQEPSENTKVGLADGLKVIQYSTGSSWFNPNKFTEYVKMIEDFVATTDKTHHLYSRWIFYLAQTYSDVGNYEKSIEVYRERISMKTGFMEEIYISLLRIAQIKAGIGYPTHEVINDYFMCMKENPNRAEHLIPIIEYYHSIGDYDISYIYSSYAMRFAGKTPENTSLFIDYPVYNWRIYDLHNLSCWWSGRQEEAKETFKLLWTQVEKGLVDEKQIPRLIGNKKFNME